MVREGPVGFGEYSDFYLLGLVGWQDAENHDLGLAFSQKVCVDADGQQCLHAFADSHLPQCECGVLIA